MELPSSLPAVRDTTDVAYFNSMVKGMTNYDIYNLVKNMFIPKENFSFPKTVSGKVSRRFNYNWLKAHSWLSYSHSRNGAYCLPCVLFGDRFPTKNWKIKNLFLEPHCHWNDAKSKFSNHESAKNGLHEETMVTFTNFMSQMSGKSQSIDLLIDSVTQIKVTENRKKLIPIVDTILLCGRQCLPLRGHCDDSQFHPEVGEYFKGSVGNFIELLNYRVRGGDIVSKEHLTKCSKNASYISKISQNELISCCGQVISDEIISEVKKNKFFSIIADEAADSSNKEQMSLVLRFVDSAGNVREDFVRFLHCEQGLSGKDLSEVILT